jgi:hypothetical protein
MKCSFLWTLLCLCVTGGLDLPAQTRSGDGLCFVWYNVENLFYPEDDSLPGDDEFTPEGVRHWSWTRYRRKLTSLAKVIVASGGGDPPELVGLCEVENAPVLEDLISHPILASYHYSYLHRDGSDHRGMEVACLYRSGRIDVVQWETLAFAPPVTTTRDMMHLTLGWKGDTLDLFLVHLISKYGGAGATAALRRIQAGQLVHCMDSVYSVRGHGVILAAGDFNDAYGGYSLEPLREARFAGDSLTPLHLQSGNGTYKYRGQWSPIDQMLATHSLWRYKVTLSTLQLPPLIMEDLQYGGIKPKRTYEGFQYSGGISDHLPMVVHLTPSLSSTPALR